MNVVMVSPGFPVEQSWFTRALAAEGATVIGVGDVPVHDLPPAARESLTHYEHVRLADTASVVRALRGLRRYVSIDQVECLWEPYVTLAAVLREELGVPGMSLAQARLFRDKEAMKEVLDAAGIRTPRHRAATTERQVWDAVEQIGYPVIVKPVDGAGSADTHRVGSESELRDVLHQVRHVPRVSVEEFVEGEEFTHDTVCGDGEVLFENIGWYRPRPLIQRTVEWISPVTISLRDIDAEPLQQGRQLGLDVLKALGFRSGFTHLEWFRTASGEVVFGEIGARPPGARSVDLMNLGTDGDLFRTWARAVLHGSAEPLTHHYNAATVFKRASGTGRITRVEGLERLVAEHRDQICAVELLPVGAPRRDWRATLLSDGMVIVRDPDLDTLVELCDRIGTDLQLYAGG